MSEVFLAFLNRSITVGWVILAVLLLRLLLKRAPRWITCLLWGIAALRLVFPFSIESVLSLIPSKEPIPQDIAVSSTPSVSTGVPMVNHAVNPYIAETFAPTPAESVNPLQVVLTVASWVWIAGSAAMLLYGAIAYLRLKRQVRVSLRLRDNIYCCDDIASPFILGIVRPRIYLPSGLSEETTVSVLAHEGAHLKRRDHWIKPFGFLLLALYWFNPLLWVAYILLCRDIEAACDEKVVRTMNTAARQEYSTALVQCSVHRRTVMMCPLAFGEVGVKARVKAVLNYKKPAFWIILVAVLASIAVAVCFLTDPKDKKPDGIGEQTSGSTFDGVSMTIVKADLTSPDPYLTVRWENDLSEDITYGEAFHLYRQVDGEWQNCAIGDIVWELPAYYVRAGGTSEKTYLLCEQIMTQPGKYRLEATFDTADGTAETAWVEFTLTQGVEAPQTYAFEAEALWYTQGGFSYVLFPEAAPTWRLVNDRQLYEITLDGVATPLGPLQQVTLDENSFDSRFIWASAWEEDAPSLGKIKQNNRRAWEVYCGENSLYLLLEQQDGTFLLGMGSYDMELSEPHNSDNSYIRWLYLLKEDDGESASISQPAVDGTVYFYSSTVQEHATPILAGYYQTEDEELATLLDLLEEQQWIYDGIVDRVEFHFDGQMRYNDKWLYFGYEDSVVCYGEYFCTASDEIIDLFRAMQREAGAFVPTH